MLLGVVLVADVESGVVVDDELPARIGAGQVVRDEAVQGGLSVLPGRPVVQREPGGVGLRLPGDDDRLFPIQQAAGRAGLDIGQGGEAGQRAARTIGRGKQAAPDRDQEEEGQAPGGMQELASR